jgi:hypothetical protein
MARTNTGLREKINYEELANLLLDEVIEMYGIEDACRMLLNAGYKKRELYYLGFETESIEAAEETIKKERKEYEQLQQGE